MKQNNVIALINASFYHLKKRNQFSKLQVKYILSRILGLKVLTQKLKLDTLKEYIGLVNNKDNNYLLDDFILQKTDDSLLEALIGMCLDIIIKDEFYILKDNSLRMHVKDKLSFYLYQEGPYEIKEVQIQNNDVIIDAGANMGIFSLVAAKKGAFVYAFEPQSIFLNYLGNNRTLNKLENKIQIYPLAIGSQVGKLSFSVNQINLLAGSINIDRDGDSIIVDCITIDEWVKNNNINKIDFIKADIEGAERLLLDGARETIIRLKPKLAICTYHLPDDKQVLRDKIIQIYPKYKLIQTRKILFAYI